MFSNEQWDSDENWCCLFIVANMSIWDSLLRRALPASWHRRGKFCIFILQYFLLDGKILSRDGAKKKGKGKGEEIQQCLRACKAWVKVILREILRFTNKNDEKKNEEKSLFNKLTRNARLSFLFVYPNFPSAQLEDGNNFEIAKGRVRKKLTALLSIRW